MSFEADYAWMLTQERGDWDDPIGGPTRDGVTQDRYDRYRDDQRLPRQSVYEADETEIRSIYREEYLAARCDEWPPAVARLVFDTALQRGPTRAIMDLQTAIGVAADGIVGPVTRGAVVRESQYVGRAGDRPGQRLVEKLLILRTDHYAKRAIESGEARKTLKGWLRRIVSLSLSVFRLL